MIGSWLETALGGATSFFDSSIGAIRTRLRPGRSFHLLGTAGTEWPSGVLPRLDAPPAMCAARRHRQPFQTHAVRQSDLSRRQQVVDRCARQLFGKLYDIQNARSLPLVGRGTRGSWAGRNRMARQRD